jgi:predicted ATP-dependent serine protease
MPRLEEIGKKWSQFIEVPSLPWLNRALNGGFVRGAVYLLAGGPGLGKTTLVNQVLGDLAILHNKFYTGLFVWGGKTYRGTHPAIVSPQLFQRAQEMGGGE